MGEQYAYRLKIVKRTQQEAGAHSGVANGRQPGFVQFVGEVDQVGQMRRLHPVSFRPELKGSLLVYLLRGAAEDDGRKGVGRHLALNPGEDVETRELWHFQIGYQYAGERVFRAVGVPASAAEVVNGIFAVGGAGDRVEYASLPKRHAKQE